MADEQLEVLVVREMPDGTFAGADTLQKLRIVQDAALPPPQRNSLRIFIGRARKRHSIYPLAPR
jgi:hypothetical protein